MSEIERDRFSRPLIAPEDGSKAVAYTRATTVSEVQGNRHNLEAWKQRQVLKGVVADPSIAVMAKTAGDDKKVLNKLVDDAHTAAKSSQAADDGTRLHDILHAVGLGEPVEIPDKWVRHVSEWQRVTADWTFICREQMVISDKYMIAGTPDAIAIVPQLGGMPVIVDWKTGATIDFGFREMAAQTAIYANAEWLYEHSDGLGRRPMPEVSLTKSLIVHLPENGGGAIRLHQLDIVEGWKAAKRSMQVRDWQKRKMSDIGTIIEHGDPVEEWLKRRVMRLSTLPDAASMLISQMDPKYGSLSQGLDLTYEDEMNTILNKIEDVCGVGFPERHPLTPTRGGKKTTK